MTTGSAILNDAPEVTVTTTLVRDGSETEIVEAIYNALDEAQAPVFNGEQPYNYVVIKIVRG